MGSHTCVRVLVCSLLIFLVAGANSEQSRDESAERGNILILMTGTVCILFVSAVQLYYWRRMSTALGSS